MNIPNELMNTRIENKDSYRLVDNPCPNEMKPEKQFLPVEF